MIKDLERLNRWRNTCPKCGADIHWTLHSGRLGAEAPARCGKSLYSSRVMDAEALKEGRIKFCNWEGVVVRMWDGSVRFKEKNGTYLFEC